MLSAPKLASILTAVPPELLPILTTTPAVPPILTAVSESTDVIAPVELIAVGPVELEVKPPDPERLVMPEPVPLASNLIASPDAFVDAILIPPVPELQLTAVAPLELPILTTGVVSVPILIP